MSQLQGLNPQEQEFLVDFAWKHREDLAEKSLLSWDYVRLINVARWSYSLNLISEKEAWGYIEFAGKELQKHYTSWFELGEHYLLGRSFWMYETRHPEIEAALFWLNNQTTSPWTTIPWETKL